MTEVQIKAFLAAAESGSFSTAAATLYLPKQAISKYIQNLEQELQTELIRRNAGKWTLTAAGLAYQKLFRSIDSQLSAVKQEAAGRLFHLNHSLRVGFLEWFDVTGLLGDCLQTYRQRRADVQLSICLSGNQQLRQALQEGGLDLIIICGNRFASQYSESADMEIRHIATEDMCLYAPDWVPGDQIAPDCWGLPLLQRTSWDWSFLEWKCIGKMAQQEFSIFPKSVQLLPNTQSLQYRMRLGNCVAITDHKFGPLRSISGLRRFQLPLKSHVSCVWRSSNESGLIPGFVDHLQAFLGTE